MERLAALIAAISALIVAGASAWVSASKQKRLYKRLREAEKRIKALELENEGWIGPLQCSPALYKIKFNGARPTSPRCYIEITDQVEDTILKALKNLNRVN